MTAVLGTNRGHEKDTTVRGLETVKSSSRVYLEACTSILLVNKERLEEFYGKDIIVADRDMVETQAEEILRGADTQDVSLLVVGDPFGATTHIDIVLRARSSGIPVRVIHNASIMNAVGACGLQLYNFGQTVSLVYFTDTWKPDSFYDRIRENSGLGLHTPVLLDIKVKEQIEENLARGKYTSHLGTRPFLKLYLSSQPWIVNVAGYAENLLLQFHVDGVSTNSGFSVVPPRNPSTSI